MISFVIHYFLIVLAAALRPYAKNKMKNVFARFNKFTLILARQIRGDGSWFLLLGSTVVCAWISLLGSIHTIVLSVETDNDLAIP